MNTCTILNVTGDVTIAWTNENNEEIKSWIETKLKEGCIFFVVEKKLGFIPVKKKITDVSNLPNEGEVKLDDKSLSKAFSTDSPKMSESPKKEKRDFMFKAKAKQPVKQKLGDKGAEKLIAEGHASNVVRANFGNKEKHKVLKMTTDPNEIMRNNTICSRRMVGG